MPGVSGRRYPAERWRVEQVPAEQPGLVDELIIGLLQTVGGLVKGVALAGWRYPITFLSAACAGVLWWRGELLPLLRVAMVLGVVALVVRLRWPAVWRGYLSEPGFRYRRRRWLARSWRRLCDRVGLTVTEVDRRTGDATVWVPTLSRLHWTSGGAVLTGRVAMVEGQTVDQLTGAADRLAAAAGARWCRIRQTGPASAELALLFGDPLAQLVPPLPVPEVPDLAALPVGVREDGAPWLLRLAGTHLLIVGVTGAGKGSVVWSLLSALAAGIRAGVVAVWAVDGKAGMELSPGRALFTRFATTADDGVELLEDAASVMTERAARMAGVARTHVATEGEPLLVVLVDEVALLTAYLPDRKLRDRAEKALAVIATQGRAPGVVLVCALQDPRKEVLGLRNLFPTKIGLRLDEKTQVDMVLGDGAREAGAVCHQIPDTTPGVAYVRVDGVREPVRVRASYLTDADIAQLATHYPAEPMGPVELSGEPA